MNSPKPSLRCEMCKASVCLRCVKRSPSFFQPHTGLILYLSFLFRELVYHSGSGFRMMGYREPRRQKWTGNAGNSLNQAVFEDERQAWQTTAWELKSKTSAGEFRTLKHRSGFLFLGHVCGSGRRMFLHQLTGAKCFLAPSWLMY